MLDRLVGLETEYALRFQPQDPAGPRIANAELFARLQTYINAKLPTVRAIGSEQCWFVANGGGLKFECFPFYKLLAAAGYVEGATPECRGPGQLLRYQRAQDVLLSQAAAASGRGDGAATLLKNSHDGRGHYYGTHENYEVTIAAGLRLKVWRIGLIVVLPLLFLLAFVGDLIAVLLSGLWQAILLLIYHLRGRSLSVRLWTSGMAWVMRFCRLPLQSTSAAFLHLTAAVHLRRHILAFLVSRVILTGAGIVSPAGRFTLSPRALSLRAHRGVSAAAWRSIFYFCQVIKVFNELAQGDAGGLRSRQPVQPLLAAVEGKRRRHPLTPNPSPPQRWRGESERLGGKEGRPRPPRRHSSPIA